MTDKHETFKQFLIREFTEAKAGEERRIMTYSGWKRACKRAEANCSFTGDADIDSAVVKDENGKIVKGIGEWDGDYGIVYVNEAKKENPTIKPRNKHLNDILMSKKGGKHYSEKTDYKRAAEKQKAKKQINRDLE